MVNLLAEVKGDSIYKQFLPALEKEYRFWMEGSAKLVPGQAYRRVVKLKDGTILNRYWDDSTSPRQESYKEDIETAEEAVRHFITVALFRDAAHQKKATDDLRRKMYRHLRAGAESGIDFSSRWFDDGQNLSTIHTTDFIPPDLNALLYNLEMTIAKAKMKQRDEIFSNEFRKKANNRLKAIQKYCYNSSIGYYTDYDFVKMQKSNSVTPGGMYPFFFFESGHDVTMINRMAAVVRARLLKDGGIVTSEKNTGQQWDAPNGWPPLVWMTVGGLEKYKSALVRPETVINKYIDPNWQPHIHTPPFPSYVSGHSVVSAAAAEVLTDVYGDNFSYTDTSETEFGIAERSFKSFRDAALEASFSRLYGGIHYRFDLVEGTKQGITLGQHVVQRLRMRKKDQLLTNQNLTN